MRRGSAIVVATATLVVAVLGYACAPSGATPATPPIGSSAATRTVAPGISEWASGTVEAAGWVAWLDLEGGFWGLRDGPAVVDGVKQPKVIAVLLPGAASETAISQLNGVFAVASGSMQGGASIRMAGPELVVDKISAARPLVK